MPQPGDRVLELAAGPGETGFRVLPRIQPGGELISTDGAPEMVEAARRRAAELGLTGVRFARRGRRATSRCADDAVDGVLCRFGLMLVPDMERGRRRDRARPAPGRAGGARGLGEHRRVNPWMTATGQGGARARLMDPPDHDAPGPFRLSDPERLGRSSRAAASRSRRSRRSRRAGSPVARRVVGDDPRHVAHAHDAPRAAARRTRSQQLRDAAPRQHLAE